MLMYWWPSFKCFPAGVPHRDQPTPRARGASRRGQRRRLRREVHRVRVGRQDHQGLEHEVSGLPPCPNSFSHLTSMGCDLFEFPHLNYDMKDELMKYARLGITELL